MERGEKEERRRDGVSERNASCFFSFDKTLLRSLFRFRRRLQVTRRALSASFRPPLLLSYHRCRCNRHQLALSRQQKGRRAGDERGKERERPCRHGSNCRFFFREQKKKQRKAKPSSCIARARAEAFRGLRALRFDAEVSARAGCPAMR